MFLKQQRDTRRHRITGFEHILDELVWVRLLETPSHRIDDRSAALVNAECINILGLKLGRLQQLLQMRGDFQQCEVEHLTSVHEE
ncbi:hypothetical protein D9M71_429870 [compost metagenome]